MLVAHVTAIVQGFYTRAADVFADCGRCACGLCAGSFAHPTAYHLVDWRHS